jgi:hypothetical protein
MLRERENGRMTDGKICPIMSRPEGRDCVTASLIAGTFRFCRIIEGLWSLRRQS